MKVTFIAKIAMKVTFIAFGYRGRWGFFGMRS
jgi:hypothetical protein